MRAALLACVIATLGCQKSDAPPVADEASRERAPSAPVEVDDQTLAAAGYYGGKRARAAWTERKNAGVVGRDGSELIGTRPVEWSLSDWKFGAPRTLAALRGQVVVVRFWTSPDCPFCRKTLPAMQELAAEFAGKPVAFVGAYHAKPIDAVADMAEPAKLAADWGVKFPIALDRDWRTLRAWWLAGAPRNATSVTFVIGKDGRIEFIHPGPEFHRSSDPAKQKQNRDFEAVRGAIAAALSK